MLLGNKCDMEDKRVVSKAKGEQVSVGRRRACPGKHIGAEASRRLQAAEVPGTGKELASLTARKAGEGLCSSCVAYSYRERNEFSCGFCFL